MDHDGRQAVPTGKGRRARTQRLEAFSDGVFAIAITLLVLDLAVPATSHTEHHLLAAIGHEWPGYLGYFVSFASIGALWLGHNAITDYLHGADSTLLRLNLVFLLFVSFLPFPTRLLAEYVTKTEAERVAVSAYGLTLLLTAVLLSVLWHYALRARLVRADAKDEELTFLTQRLTPGLAGYAVLIAVGLFEPVLAVMGYLLVALFFLIPIRIRRTRQPT